MITTVVFDIGQVLANFIWEPYIRSFGFEEEVFQRVAKATVLSSVWPEQDRGRLSDEEIIDLCIQNDPSVALEIRKIFDTITDIVVEYDYSTSWIEELKAKGLKVYLLSNYGRRTFEYAKEHFEFLKHVDGGVISYEVLQIKPEPEIYQSLIDKYQLNPKEAVFIDDRIENLEGAKPFGFHTICFHTLDQVKQELEQLIGK